MLKKHPSFHLSFQVVLRLLIFILIVYFSIIYLSQGKTNLPSIPIPPLIKFLPPSSQSTINNFSNLPQIKFLQNKLNDIKSETAGFPQKQINDIKKAVVEKIYQSVMQSIK